MRVSPITSAYLHCKFLGDFHQKAIQETKRKQHWAGGIFYQRYSELFEGQIDDNFKFTDLPKVTKI